MKNEELFAGAVIICNVHMCGANRGVGAGMSFSLEIPLGLRFVVESRLFTYEEVLALEAQNMPPKN